MVEAARIVFADDHPTFQLGLKQLSSSNPAFTVIGAAGDGLAALDLIRDLQPVIAVLDWEIPGMNELEITRRVRRERLPTRVIVPTMHNEERLVNKSVDVGVSDSQSLMQFAIENRDLP